MVEEGALPWWRREPHHGEGGSPTYGLLEHISVSHGEQALHAQLDRVEGQAGECSAVQCSAVQCSAVQCSAVQCSAVQCTRHPGRGS